MLKERGKTLTRKFYTFLAAPRCANGMSEKPTPFSLRGVGVSRREYREHHPYPENIFWLIEYANSSLEKNLERKSKIYAEAGILEYWVVNLKKLHLVVFREILDGEYSTKLTFTARTIQPLAFPDISVAVAQIINS